MQKSIATRRYFLKTLGLGAAAFSLSGAVPKAADKARPNIALIMVDDMGYSDIGCYGGEIDTPNLNQLAKNGVRFTQFYNTGRCCPTRASLLTGLYPHQAGMGWMTAANMGTDAYAGDLNKHCVTIAEVLKPSGYGTCMAGKWHVTYDLYHDGRDKSSWPRQRGFDHFFGTISGGGNYFAPATLTRENNLMKAGNGFYYTDAISDNAVNFIREHDKTRPSDPLFLYVAYTAPHWPLHAKPKDIAKYRGRYRKGWDALRVERHKRMIEMGIVEKDWPLTPRDNEANAWDSLSEEKQDEMDLRMAVYAAQVDSMDQGVGRVVEALRKTRRFDNTLILFLADNGGCAENISGGSKDLRDIGSTKSHESYRLPWANASNTPFRLFKHYVHEGGIATPLIAHWPRGIKAKGELRHQPGHLIDIMATCVDLSGATYPLTFQKSPIHPMEGQSLLPVFVNAEVAPRTIYWEHEANRAMRQGDWKLVAKGLKGKWELYDLKTDRTELNNLAGRYPERAKEMAETWGVWAKRVGAYPLSEAGWGARIALDKSFSKMNPQTHFELSQGDDLSQAQGPDVAGKSIHLRADVEPTGTEGVIVAQGGWVHGYSLYLKDGYLTLALRIDSEFVVVKSATRIPKRRVCIEALLGKEGQVTLKIDDKVVATGKASSCLTTTPLQGLQVGSDAEHNVSREYKVPFTFEGTVHSVVIDLK